MEERPPCKRRVEGSSPSSSTIFVVLYSGAMVARRTVNARVAGSSPAYTAICSGMV